MPRAKNLKDRSQYFTRYKTITKNRYFYIVLLAIVTFIIFWQVIGYEFVKYDDDFTVYENPYLQSDAVSNILHFWKNPYKDAYLPLTGTLLAIQAIFAKTTPSDSNIIKFNPAIFHTTNLIFHIVNAILVFLILRILIKDELASFFGALLFALHPVQVESVAWVTGIKDVFSGFFSLIAIWQYLIYAKLSMISPEGNETDQDGFQENPDRKRKALHYLMAIFSFVLAILAKPTRAIVVIVAFTLDYFILKRRFQYIVVSIIGWIAVSLPLIAVTIILMPAPNETTFSFSFLERLLVVSDSLVFYLYKLILPISLGPDYGRTIKFVLSQKLIYFAWIIPALLLIIIYTIKKHRSWLVASAGIFIAGVLPMLGFIRFQFQEVSTVADRYLYLSMLGPGMILAFILSMIKKRLITGICGVMLGLLAILSILQTQNWENTITFYKHALKINPDSTTFHSSLGIYLGQQGKYDEAIIHFKEGLRLDPNNPVAYNNIGIVLTQQRKFDEAIYQFNEALRIEPNNAGARLNLGHALAQQGKFNEAISNYFEVLMIEPDNAGARLNLGLAFAQQGKFNEAISNYFEVLRIEPNNAEVHNILGVVLAQQGKFDEAIYHFNEALKISPGFEDAHKNLIKAKSLNK